MKIVPMRDLKDTVKIENMCSETKAPVFVTKNGYGKLVVMDIECFERLMNDVYEAKAINGKNPWKRPGFPAGNGHSSPAPGK